MWRCDICGKSGSGKLDPSTEEEALPEGWQILDDDIVAACPTCSRDLEAVFARDAERTSPAPKDESK